MVVFTVATALYGCDRPQPTGVSSLHHPNIDDLFADAVWTLGLEPSDDSLLVFGRIQDATFVGQDHIAVLDLFPPFLRIFDRRGRVIAALLPEGGGPGEARNPYSISGNQGGQIVVLHDARVSLFDVGSGFVDSFRLDHTAQDIGRGCSGWTIYGPTRVWNESGERPWTRTVRFDPDGIKIDHEGLYASSSPRVLRHGPGPVAVGRGDWVLFDASSTRTALPACETGFTARLPDRVVGDIENVMHRSQEDFEQMLIRPWDTTPTGFTVMDSEVLLSAFVYDPQRQFNSLLIHFTGTGPVAGSSQRLLKLRDVSEVGDLLLVLSEPVPHVVIMPAERVIASLHSIQRDPQR